MAGETESIPKRGADVSLKVAGQEVNVKNIKSLNTIATVATLFAVCLLGMFLYFHEAGAQQDKAVVAKTLEKSNSDIASALKESNRAIVDAIKETNASTVQALREFSVEQRKATRAMAEVACLNDPAIRNQPNAREFCRRRAGDDR